MARSPRVLKETCLSMVLKRLMDEMDIEIHDIVNETGIPKSTIWDWREKVIPSNPDQLKILLDFLKKRDPEITLELLYYGKDQDKEAMRKRLEELEEKNRKLEFENGMKQSQLNFFDEILNEKKKEIKELKADRKVG